MAEFQPIPIGRPPPRSWLPALGSVLVLLVALAVVKPWHVPDPGDPEASIPNASVAPVVPRTASPRADRDLYDPRLFGNREPDPAWELWPAGYVVEFGMAGPVAVRGQESAAPSGDPVRSLEPGQSPPATEPAASPSPPALSPEEHVVDLGPADHLIALGINTPADVRVTEVRLVLLEGLPDGSDVPIVRLPTLWESDHFLVIGIADPDRPAETGPWIPGEYLLELVTADGEFRAVRLRVSAPAN